MSRLKELSFYSEFVRVIGRINGIKFEFGGRCLCVPLSTKHKWRVRMSWVYLYHPFDEDISVERWWVIVRDIIIIIIIITRGRKKRRKFFPTVHSNNRYPRILSLEEEELAKRLGRVRSKIWHEAEAVQRNIIIQIYIYRKRDRRENGRER